MEFNLFPKFIDEAMSPVAKSVGNTVSGIWDLAIGNQVSLWLKKQEVKQIQNFEEFVALTQNEISLIPAENLIEPELHLLGPILEASKYSLNSEELRKIFAKLVASCLDSTSVDILHPSYIEIVKQLSPNDAALLASASNEYVWPIISLGLSEDSNKEGKFSLDYSISYAPLYEHILPTEGTGDYLGVTVIIDNLLRLGLITITYESSLVSDGVYNYIDNHPSYKDAQSKLVEAQSNNKPFNSVKVNKGILRFTELGKNFQKICIEGNSDS
ncbi:MAG: DUF4393 domain-containing protein [Lysinibacillus sp.]